MQFPFGPICSMRLKLKGCKKPICLEKKNWQIFEFLFLHFFSTSNSLFALLGQTEFYVY